MVHIKKILKIKKRIRKTRANNSHMLWEKWLSCSAPSQRWPAVLDESGVRPGQRGPGSLPRDSGPAAHPSGGRFLQEPGSRGYWGQSYHAGLVASREWPQTDGKVWGPHCSSQGLTPWATRDGGMSANRPPSFEPYVLWGMEHTTTRVHSSPHNPWEILCGLWIIFFGINWIKLYTMYKYSKVW